MAFILNAQREADCRLAFARYRKYLEENRRHFPASAYALASSDWWYDFKDRRCPHDGTVISSELSESTSADGAVEISLTLLLACAWEAGGRHEITWHGIVEYSMSAEAGLHQGHGDWRYDELRAGYCHADQKNRVVHEIEFGSALWMIQCRDVSHSYCAPKGESTD